MFFGGPTFFHIIIARLVIQEVAPAVVNADPVFGELVYVFDVEVIVDVIVIGGDTRIHRNLTGRVKVVNGNGRAQGIGDREAASGESRAHDQDGKREGTRTKAVELAAIGRRRAKGSIGPDVGDGIGIIDIADAGADVSILFAQAGHIAFDQGEFDLRGDAEYLQETLGDEKIATGFGADEGLSHIITEDKASAGGGTISTCGVDHLVGGLGLH